VNPFKNIVFICLIFSSGLIQAKVKVLFLASHHGEQLDSSFLIHAAISYKGLWLHAHPYYGIKLSSNFEILKTGFPHTEIILENAQEPSFQFVKKSVQQTFDLFSPWTSKKTTYCSKLIAKWLNIEPSPMSFNDPFWPKEALIHRGSLGISPKDLLLNIESKYKLQRFDYFSDKNKNKTSYCKRIL
jgi:hypothetical protein